MTILSTTKDPGTLTFTITSHWPTPPVRVWQLWSDPRQLERWWGPPTWPATFEQHEVVVGGRSSYFMTGPQGEKARGWWRFTVLQEHERIEFDDGFSDESGTPDESMPTIRVRVELEEADAGTRMTITSTFASAEQMDQLAAMGMVEGMTAAMGQIDEVLAAG